MVKINDYSLDQTKRNNECVEINRRDEEKRSEMKQQLRKALLSMNSLDQAFK